jgi:hypothetical protein
MPLHSAANVYLQLRLRCLRGLCNYKQFRVKYASHRLKTSLVGDFTDLAPQFLLRTSRASSSRFVSARPGSRPRLAFVWLQRSLESDS